MNEFFKKLLRVLLCLPAFSLLVGNLGKKKKKAKYRGSKNCVKSSLDDRLIILPIMLI